EPRGPARHLDPVRAERGAARRSAGDRRAAAGCAGAACGECVRAGDCVAHRAAAVAAHVRGVAGMTATSAVSTLDQVMERWEPVIGLEVHGQLLTQSKMFCGCSADYIGSPPN